MTIATSNQPEVDPTLRFYNSAISKAIPTMRVKLKGSSDGGEMTINETDFDPDRHERLD